MYYFSTLFSFISFQILLYFQFFWHIHDLSFLKFMRENAKRELLYHQFIESFPWIPSFSIICLILLLCWGTIIINCKNWQYKTGETSDRIFKMFEWSWHSNQNKGGFIHLIVHSYSIYQQKTELALHTVDVFSVFRSWLLCPMETTSISVSVSVLELVDTKWQGEPSM